MYGRWGAGGMMSARADLVINLSSSRRPQLLSRRPRRRRAYTCSAAVPNCSAAVPGRVILMTVLRSYMLSCRPRPSQSSDRQSSDRQSSDRQSSGRHSYDPLRSAFISARQRPTQFHPAAERDSASDKASTIVRKTSHAHSAVLGASSPQNPPNGIQRLLKKAR